MKINYKKLSMFIVLLFFLVSCSGGSYKITVGDVEANSHSIYGNYNSFTGHYYKKVTLEPGESLKVIFTLITEKGKLTVQVIDSDGKLVKELSNNETFYINDPDKYKFQVIGEKHKGSFSLYWEKE